MSATSSDVLDTALQGVPNPFRDKITAAYRALKSDFAESRFDSAGLNVGKFCEATIRLLQHNVLGAHTPFGKPIPNFADECRKIITATSSTVPEPVRVLIPRALVFAYSMRSKRGIGHLAGDVDANGIDSATMIRVADWVLCELIRAYHAVSLEEAQDLIDSISFRQLPTIWSVNGKRRVLATGLTAGKQALLLLYSDPRSVVLAEDLCAWVEYSSLRDFKRLVLKPLHAKRLIELDLDSDTVHLSPKGAAAAEDILRSIT